MPVDNCPAVLAATGTTAKFLKRSDLPADQFFSLPVIAWSHYGEPLVDGGAGVLVSAVGEWADDAGVLVQVTVPRR